MASNKKWERAQTFHLDTSHSNNLGQLRSALEAEKHPVYICVLSVSPSHQNPRQATEWRECLWAAALPGISRGAQKSLAHADRGLSCILGVQDNSLLSWRAVRGPHGMH